MGEEWWRVARGWLDRLRRLGLESAQPGEAQALPAVELPYDGELVLGRSRSCDVRLIEPSVSRRHAELRRTDGGWLLVDWASTNGTWVNGVRVERAHVADGDEIRLGGARFTLRNP
jgi:pSer/pThr/pTyr-binding forkhead associated (FHA) protein